MDTHISSPLRGSKNGNVVIDDSNDRLSVYNDDADKVADIGSTDDGRYGLQVIEGGVSVGLTTVASNITQTITITVTGPTGSAPIVSSWDDTFYKDSATSDGAFENFTQGSGKPWNGLTKSQYDVHFFNSYQNTDDTNVKHIAMFKNRSGSSVDTIYIGQMRAIVVGASAS